MSQLIRSFQAPGQPSHPSQFPQAPELQISGWLNTREPLSLSYLRGRVIMVHVFQMLCPGCVSRGIPQAQKVAALFDTPDLVVLGLHSVFEHHAAMEPHALQAFLHEYRINFPVGIDAPGEDSDPRPLTMRRYGMQGTPTTLLIDGAGRLRRHLFGGHEDLLLGAEIQTLLLELSAVESDAKTNQPAVAASEEHTVRPNAERAACGEEGCSL